MWDREKRHKIRPVVVTHVYIERQEMWSPAGASTPFRPESLRYELWPELRSSCCLLTGRGTQNVGLKQCSSPETLPYNFEDIVFAAWRKTTAERMGEHIDAKQLRGRQ